MGKCWCYRVERETIHKIKISLYTITGLPVSQQSLVTECTVIYNLCCHYLLTDVDVQFILHDIKIHVHRTLHRGTLSLQLKLFCLNAWQLGRSLSIIMSVI